MRITEQVINGRDAVAHGPAGYGGEATRLARSANPTSIQLGQHAALPLPETYPTRGKAEAGSGMYYLIIKCAL